MAQDTLAAHNEMLEKFLAMQQVSRHNGKRQVLTGLRLQLIKRNFGLTKLAHAAALSSS